MRRTLERYLERFYARFGARGQVALALVAGSTSATLDGLMLVVLYKGYLRASFSETAGASVLAAAALVVGLLAGVVWSAGVIRTVLSWHGDGRTEGRAPEVWRAVVIAPRLVVTRVGICLIAAAAPAAAFAANYLGEPTVAWIPMFLAAASAIVANCVFVMFGVEIMLRPLLRDVATKLPRDFEPNVRTMSLRGKILSPIPGATLFAGMFVGAYAYAFDDHAARFGLALGIALALAAVAVAMFWIAARSTLDPIERLTAATRDVREGDLSGSIPLLTADELGTLAQSFNEMVEGLRERESLREDNVLLLDEVRARADELQRSRARIVAASDEARSRVERDLHDGAQQHLVLSKLKLGLLDRAVADDPEAANLAGELRVVLDRALEELRDLAHGIYPATLSNSGLPAALRDAAQRAAIPTEVEADGVGRLSAETEAAVYFCCLEALQNAGKYAGDDAAARVTLTQRDGRLDFEVSDDGVGFDGEAAAESAGMQNMTDRIGAIGGELRVESRPGKGTRIAGSMPADAPPDSG